MEAPARAHTERSDLPTHGWRVAKIATAIGKPLMPWQQRAADVALEYDPDAGLYRYGTVVVSVPRQSGKTALEGSVATALCLYNKKARARITMQDGKTADEWMREQHFEDLDESRQLKGRYVTTKRAGAHGVSWKSSRSTFITFPPTRKALHSKQSDLVFVDEAWAHDAETGRQLKQAIRPTFNTRPNGQLWIVSTRGDAKSAYLDEYLARGRASIGNPNSRTCFIDYGIDAEDDADDFDVIAAHHPAYGRTISKPSLIDAYEEFRDPETGLVDLGEWARAYGNRATTTAKIVFPESVWAEAACPQLPVPARAGLALDASPDGRRFALAASWQDATGDSYVEILEAGKLERSTPELVRSYATARGVPIHVDRQAQAALEITDAWENVHESARPTVEFASLAQYGSACVTLYRGIFDNTVHHFNDPDLDDAIKNAVQRDHGDDGWVWGRKASAGPIVELVAATLALRAFSVLPAPKRRPIAVM